MQVRGNDVVQVSVRMDSSFPRRRESRHSMLRQFIEND
ncbi:PilS cassette [Neisseria meningitidis serogroup B]|uniref:PilS cassette n=1 Tax=Neisseria meningitidis serogroup B TaxID=491 RepID=A0A0H5Q8M9_NEIMI|nr:PilS cassette [Neisseria meningitidis serogroup B]